MSEWDNADRVTAYIALYQVDCTECGETQDFDFDPQGEHITCPQCSNRMYISQVM